MIPPENMAQDDDSGEREKEKPEEVPPSPAISVTQQETKNTVRPEHQKRKLQRLKRSLSFKTKSIRSKSADNFFRSGGDNKAELLSDVSSSTGHLSTVGIVPPHNTHHTIPPVPPAIPCAPPPSSRSPSSRSPYQLDAAGHCFMEHIFKKPTFCDVCNHMIVGTTAKHVVFLAGNTAKHGLRCKACKMSLHHKCEHGVGKQRCQGKLPKGFRRYYSSPLLIQEQFGCIKEVMPIGKTPFSVLSSLWSSCKMSNLLNWTHCTVQLNSPILTGLSLWASLWFSSLACGNKVDPVYEALRMGTSLAQKAKRASGSDSPHRNSTSDLDKVPEEIAGHSSGRNLSRNHSDDVFTGLENGTEHYQPERKFEDLEQERLELQKDILQLNTYVALFSFTPQDDHDLEMRPGDRILLADDSNDDWWKGIIEDRIGYFPAAYAHQVEAEDQVFRCNRTFIGCKEQGQITLKEGQICVSSEDEQSGFIRVASREEERLRSL
ncbi:SH3 and cysteine-rich domain-containing protein [Merluccius polli]|uniref:SH3 and cysteine-rich domain-containing protein n=1 Tax=Merluccius polli TaxID=89951 RepID=A0AA47N866_MERPO|nr:SH3 and cysteine-rich domain-containing protein [Merluccius polli]